MLARQNGVTIEHAGAGVSHHRFNFFPHVRFIAMDWALGAGRLVRLKRAVIDPLIGIGQKRLATGAKGVRRILGMAVVVMAIDLDHDPDGVAFPF